MVTRTPSVFFIRLSYGIEHKLEVRPQNVVAMFLWQRQLRTFFPRHVVTRPVRVQRPPTTREQHHDTPKPHLGWESLHFLQYLLCIAHAVGMLYRM
jgi:hypothetical protein